MQTKRGKYSDSHQPFDGRLASDSGILEKTFVADSLKRNEANADGLNAFRGSIYGMIVSLVFWFILVLTIIIFF